MLRVLSAEEVHTVSGGVMADDNDFEDGGGFGGGDFDSYQFTAADGGGGDAPRIPYNFGNDLNDDQVTFTPNQNSGDIVVTAPWIQSNFDLSRLSHDFQNISDGFGTAADIGGAATTVLTLSAAAQAGLDVPNDFAVAAAGVATVGAVIGKFTFKGLSFAVSLGAQQQ